MRWLLILAVLVAGCSTDLGPNQAEIRAQREAENVYPKNYKNDLLAFLRTWLNDPSHIRAGAVSAPMLRDVGHGERYVACLRYNARGTDGTYKGVKTGAAIYVSGKLDRFLDDKDARGYCADVRFTAFPELGRLSR